MRPTTCPRGFINRLLFAVTVACLTVSVLIGQEPQPPVKPKDLTAEQKERLKERDRLKAEVEKFRKADALAEAIEVCEKQLSIEVEVYGEAHDDVVKSLQQLAAIHEEREEWPTAKEHRERVLRIESIRFGDKDWRVTDARIASAHVDKLTMLSTDERRELREAVRLNETVEQLWGQGKYVQAEELCRKCLTICQRVLGPGHPYTALSLNNLGTFRQSQGDYLGARPHYEQALAVNKKTLGVEHPETAANLNNLGSLLRAQGDFAGARLYFEQALAAKKKSLGLEHADTALGLNNLGTLLHSQGDYAAARPYYEQALAIFTKTLGPEHPRTATVLNNVGHLFQKQWDFAGAQPYYQRALDIKKKSLGLEHPDTAVGLNNLGGILKAQGDYAGARPLYEQALEIFKKARGPDHSDTALGLINLGSLLMAQGNTAEGRPYYEQALAIYRKALGPQHPEVAETLKNMGYLFQGQGDFDEARRHFEDALTITQTNQHHAASGLAERQQMAMARQLRPDLDSWLSVSTGSSAGGKDIYAAVLQTKGAVLARQHRLRLSRQESELKEDWEQLQRINNRLATLAFAMPDPKKRENWRRQIDDATREKEDAELKLTRLSAAYRLQKELQGLTTDQLRSALPSGTALVDILEYDHMSYPSTKKGHMLRERRLAAFVLRSNASVVRVDFGPAAPIVAAVSQWRESFGQSSVAREVDPAARLRQLIWEPLDAHLGDAKVVLISPDGLFARLPIGALPGKQSGTYLIEERAVVAIPVPQLLPELLSPPDNESQKPIDASLLLVGDVEYSCDPGKSGELADVRRGAGNERGGQLQKWSPLLGTRKEIDDIGQSFKNRFGDKPATVHDKSRPTESAFRKHAPRHKYLHLASHGFFAPEKIKSALAPTTGEKFVPGDLFQHEPVTGFHPGLLSGLVLAGANHSADPGSDDGILTALEVASLDLSNVDLAVLSACETGLGEVAGGEGLLGLQRAFQTAGARSVVAGLWKVPDRATQMLMTRFYENLWDKKMSKLEALRQAQIWMLREVPKDEKLLRDIRRDLGDDKPEQVKIGDGPLPPYYWAGFVLSGDWR